MKSLIKALLVCSVVLFSITGYADYCPNNDKVMAGSGHLYGPAGWGESTNNKKTLGGHFGPVTFIGANYQKASHSTFVCCYYKSFFGSEFGALCSSFSAKSKGGGAWQKGDEVDFCQSSDQKTCPFKKS